MRLAWGLLGALMVAAACSSTAGLSAGDEDPSDAGGTKPKDSGAPKTDGGSSDAPTPIEVGCDPSKPFGAPALQSQFDVGTDYVKGAVRTPDGLETFYLRYQGSGNWDLRRSKRASKSDPWPQAETIPMGPSPDGFLSLTAGGLKLYFWTLEQNYRVTRPSLGALFGAIPTKYDVPSGPMAFFVDADDMAYFGKLEEGGTERTLRRATANTGGFSTSSQVVPNLHVTGTSNQYAVLNQSETVIYFSSNRSGKGLADIFRSSRASKTDEFNTPTHVPEVSTDEPDQVTWVSEDDCELLLDRANHIYSATRPK